LFLNYRGDAEHPIILDHLIRFLTHALLAFAIADLNYNELLTNIICDAYINVRNSTKVYIYTTLFVLLLELIITCFLVGSSKKRSFCGYSILRSKINI
jgi:hypothetical protein